MSHVGDVGEFGLIERIARILPGSPQVLEGIGDDCAVLRFGDRILLVSTDLSIENVHFRRDYATPEEIGWKAAAASLSDIAAMGGTPLFALTSLACSPSVETAFIEGLYQGIGNAMSRFGAAVVGGDTARPDSDMVIDVTVIGEARGNRYRRRKGARIGDLLAVTGHLGLSAGGLHALQHGHAAPKLIYIHHHPSPRVPEGEWLARAEGTRALMDVSDGLIQDAGHIARVNQLGIDIFPDRLPVYPPLARYCEEHGLDPRPLMLTGGEDYELLFTMSAHDSERTIAEFHREFRTELTVIGRVTDDWVGVRIDGQEPTGLPGYDHFRTETE